MARRDPTLPFAFQPEGAAGNVAAPAAGERLAAALSADSARLRRLALRITRDPAAADDVVQNALEKALRYGAGFRGEAMPSTWLHRIVVNEALIWRRSEGRRRRLAQAAHSAAESSAAPFPQPLDELLLREQRERVLRELAALRGGDGELLASFALEGSWARASRMRPAVAKMRAFRARHTLRAALAEGDA